jgi:hypothetical protein
MYVKKLFYVRRLAVRCSLSLSLSLSLSPGLGQGRKLLAAALDLGLEVLGLGRMSAAREVRKGGSGWGGKYSGKDVLKRNGILRAEWFSRVSCCWIYSIFEKARRFELRQTKQRHTAPDFHIHIIC